MRYLTTNLWRLATVVTTVALVLLATATISAAQDDPQGPQKPDRQEVETHEPSESRGEASTQVGGTTTKTNVVTEAGASITNSRVFANVPGANTTVFVAPDERALILARFSAESACSGGSGSNWCSIRILIGGVEANPIVGQDFAFDSTNNGADGPFSWESHSVDRSRTVGPGAYTVQVQWSVTGPNVSFRLDDWSLTVERVQLVP